MRTRWPWQAYVGAAAGIVFAASLVRVWVRTPGFIDTDTYQVLDGVGRISDCLSHGITPCGPGVNEFALLQYLPALALKELGTTFYGAARDLVHLNGICFALLLALAVPLARTLKSQIAGVAFAVAVLTSPALWYAHAGHGELIASLVITALIVCLLAGSSPVLIAITTVLAVMSKETAFPFLLLLAFAAHRARLERGRPNLSRGQIGAVIGGTVVGIAANVGFNLFRYDTPGNQDYLRAQLHVPPLQVLGNAAALLVGPTGGLIWFWPLALVIIIGGWVVAWRSRSSIRAAVRAPLVVSLAVFLGLLALFSLWYSPYGGAGWGPRLLLPWMPALVVITLAAAPAVTRAIARCLSGRRWVAVWAAVALVGLPQLGSMVNTSHYWHAYPGVIGDPAEIALTPFFPDRACPRYPAIADNRRYYFRCLNHQTWDRGLAVGRGLKAVGDVPLLLAVSYVLTLGGLVWLAGPGSAELKSRTRTPL